MTGLIAGESIEPYSILYIRKDGKVYMTPDDKDECQMIGINGDTLKQ